MMLMSVTGFLMGGEWVAMPWRSSGQMSREQPPRDGILGQTASSEHCIKQATRSWEGI